jgi:hypothetical protein
MTVSFHGCSLQTTGRYANMCSFLTEWHHRWKFA